MSNRYLKHNLPQTKLLIFPAHLPKPTGLQFTLIEWMATPYLSILHTKRWDYTWLHCFSHTHSQSYRLHLQIIPSISSPFPPPQLPSTILLAPSHHNLWYGFVVVTSLSIYYLSMYLLSIYLPLSLVIFGHYFFSEVLWNAFHRVYKTSWGGDCAILCEKHRRLCLTRVHFPDWSSSRVGGGGRLFGNQGFLDCAVLLCGC